MYITTPASSIAYILLHVDSFQIYIAHKRFKLLNILDLLTKAQEIAASALPTILSA